MENNPINFKDLLGLCVDDNAKMAQAYVDLLLDLSKAEKQKMLWNRKNWPEQAKFDLTLALQSLDYPFGIYDFMTINKYTVYVHPSELIGRIVPRSYTQYNYELGPNFELMQLAVFYKFISGAFNRAHFRGLEWNRWKYQGNWKQGWHFHLGSRASGLGKHHLPQQTGNWVKNLASVIKRLF